MHCLALGDSISIDDSTEVPGGGAASQFARLIGADSFQVLAYDGCTTTGVLTAIERIEEPPDIITLTAGGNDLLEAVWWRALEKPGVPPELDGLEKRILGLLRAILIKLGNGVGTVPFKKDTLEDVYEPYLIQEGYLNRTPRGRIATPRHPMMREMATPPRQ